MVQIIEEKPSFWSAVGGGAKRGINKAFEQYAQMSEQKRQKELQTAQMQQENKQIKDVLGIDLTNVYDPKLRAEIVAQKLRGAEKSDLFDRKIDAFKKIRGGTSQDPSLQGQQSPDMQIRAGDQGQMSDDEIFYLSLIDPASGRLAQSQKKEEHRQFEGDRSYHSGFSKEADREVEGLRSGLAKKEMALNFSREAIETGDPSYFSRDKIADVTGVDLFRTAKGAQLITAGKENLLSNMTKVSGKAQNMWFEQRLNSMFPKIGQSMEANLTVQEMLEGEAAMDKAYINEFDRIAEEDEKQYGFERKDIAKRANNAVKDKYKQILQRTTYRMKEIEEQEAGLTNMKRRVDQNVPKGTPLTLAMAKLYKDKHGDKALKVAEKNGYYIPTIEEYQMIRATPQEYREGL